MSNLDPGNDYLEDEGYGSNYSCRQFGITNTACLNQLCVCLQKQDSYSSEAVNKCQ